MTLSLTINETVKWLSPLLIFNAGVILVVTVQCYWGIVSPGISIDPRQYLLEDNSAFNQRTVKKGYCECDYKRQWNPKRHTDDILPLFSYHVFFNLSDVRFKRSYVEEALSKEDKTFFWRSPLLDLWLGL